MTEGESSIHDATVWAKNRLDEMDAAIGAMEERMRTLTDTAQVQAHLALLDARKWREMFLVKLKDLRRAARNKPELNAQLESIWEKFEGAFARWVEGAGRYAEVLGARADAQAKAWSAVIENYRAELESRAKVGRERVTSGIQAMEEAAARQKDELRKLEAAGAASCAAWSDALARSRTAFDEALRKTREQFTKAAE